MLYKELKAVQDQKALLLQRLRGAKKATKKKKPRKKKRLNPVMGSRFMQINSKHLKNNSVQKSLYGSIQREEEPNKRGRGYHMVNNFERSQSPALVDGFSVFRSSVNESDLQYRSNQSGMGLSKRRKKRCNF